MKLQLVFLLLFFSMLTTLSAYPPLASVEYSTKRTAPPVEQKKVKKKKRKKQTLKKPDHNLKTKTKISRIRIAVATGILWGTTLMFILLLFLLNLDIFTLGATILILSAFGLIVACFVMLVVTIIFCSVDYHRQHKKTPPLKRPEAELRAEVAYLNPEKIDRYVKLNEEYTKKMVARRSLTTIITDQTKTPQERQKAKRQSAILKEEIRVILRTLKQYRRQNRTKQVRTERD